MATKNSKYDFRVVGSGLAGSEAALVLARAGARVELFEQKPIRFSAAHKNSNAAELVCSNSLKSTELSSAHGLLKEELRLLASPLVDAACKSRVPGGKALSVDREIFSKMVTDAISGNQNIIFRREEFTEIIDDGIPTLLATGPLTSDALTKSLQDLLKDGGLYFYDATAPVVTLSSLDQSKFFWGNRHQDGDDYLNLPLDLAQYREFRDSVLAAEKFESHLPEENLKFFEGCLPIEELAIRGEDTLAFSCMRPIGFHKWTPKKAHAVIQFRREKAAGELLSMVGFQTRMKWPEQERVFRALPGMAEAEFVRLGAMHRNTFINTPLHLTDRLQLKLHPQIYMAGQITGSEGYSEAIATGHYAALQMLGHPAPPEACALRSLVRYLVTSDPKHFQPMNFSFGLLPSVNLAEVRGSASNFETPSGAKIKLKTLKNEFRVRRALLELNRWKKEVFSNSPIPIWNSKDYSHGLVLTPTELAPLISNF